jgi:hypothetical protein
MAKFQEASDDVVKLFDEVRDKTTIPQWVEFKVLCNNKQKKEPIKLVKSNDLVETLSEGINFAIVINEEIFCELPEDMQAMAIDECLAGVGVSDADVLTTEKPDFNTHTGVLQKYGDAPIITLHESIKSLYDAKKQKEDEEKAAKKGKRGKKNVAV